jgi:hypothetical protein
VVTLRLPYELAAFKRSPANLRLLADAQPDAAYVLLGSGVPVELFGGRFRAADSLAPLNAGTRRLVWFGNEARSVRVCVDPASGEVVSDVNAPDARPAVVNTTLGQFVATAEAVVGRFPFYDGGADLEERQQVADELAAIIQAVDPAAMLPDRLWSTLVDDVAIGDFATEDLIREPG